ncbi:MAG: helix-turn-helix transcriptional regulator [Candidatus Pacebacteria bacterium]|nr:helix-turn-helix transcriptional regulator [Candidatus Paceibacterota bacterium]
MVKPIEELYKQMDPQVVKEGQARGKRLIKQATALNELRRSLNISQVDMAKKLTQSQVSISQLENQDNPRIESLRRYLNALGADLELNARFPDGSLVPLSDYHPKQ